MIVISQKTIFELKKVAVLCSLFLGTFLVGFYIVNLLEVNPVVKTTPKIVPTQVQDLTLDEDLLKKTSADGINLADFSAWVKTNKLAGKDVYNADPDGDGLPNYLEFIHGTNPNNADTDGDKFSDKQEIVNGYDPDAPGDTKPIVYVKIEKIAVDVPWFGHKAKMTKKP